MKLSVIVVAYKSANEIRNCLISLSPAIGSPECEVLVVNNSPEDTLGEIVAHEFPWVIYIPAPENIGFGAANNVGFNRSSGDFVLFLNPDTICNSQALTHCLSRLNQDQGIGLISPKLVLADGSMDLACRRSIPSTWDGFCRAAGLSRLFPNRGLFCGYNLTHLPPDGTYDVGAINGAFMMGRRAVLEKVGLFDESFFMYGDDLDLCIRIRKAGYKIVYDGRVSIIHLKGLSVAKSYDSMADAIFDANRDVYLKHFNPRNSTWVRWRYHMAFGLWKKVSRVRARMSGYKRVKPL